MKLIPKEEDFKRAAHSPQVTSRIGIWLGVTFTICFITGLLSHFIQHPVWWFPWPTRPVWLYRVTQGVHVVSGTAAVPLLIAKLWSVYPKLFARPIISSVGHLLRRISITILVAASIFELVSGGFNAAQVYPWKFFFPPVHYAVAWVVFGALLIHVAVELPVIKKALGTKLVEIPTKGVSRRGFLRTTWIATGVAVFATAGSSMPLLGKVSPLSARLGKGPQGLPINRTAHAARIPEITEQWRLTVGTAKFSLADLRRMPQTTVQLPIACVEGWSQSATWTGVRLRDLLAAAGVSPTALVVRSLEQGGIYGSSVLPKEFVADDLTLLALQLNGEILHPDHGFPCRIMAPNRPGVLQTKWVSQLEAIA
jgi:hypothetical protein